MPKSHEIIQVSCEEKISEKCRGSYDMEFRQAQKIRSRNDGKIICLFCHRTKHFSGRNNPNSKYKFNDGLFSEIDSKNKAYILGFFAGDGNASGNTVKFNIHEKDIGLLENIRDFFDPNLPITHHINHTNSKTILLSISSKKISQDMCKHIMVEPNRPKSFDIRLPKIQNEYIFDFIRGYFDADGSIIKPKHSKSPTITFASGSKLMLEDINQIFPGGKIYQNAVSTNGIIYSLEYIGNTALDFLGKMYDNMKDSLYLHRKYSTYLDWCFWIPALSGEKHKYYKDEKIVISKCHDSAILPSKSRISDSGYDLTAIEISHRNKYVIFYKTGIKVTPAQGFCLFMIPRSSITKTGHMMANSIGLIDRSYVGEVLIPLIKIDPNTPDLELPCRIAQLVPIPTMHFPITEGPVDTNTTRGEGGFGSTGK